MPTYMTVGKAAAEIGVSRYVLNRLRDKGKVPGFYNGALFYVNVDLLKQRLLRESYASMREGGRNDNET